MTKIKKIKRSIKMWKCFFVSVDIFIMLFIFATIFLEYHTRKRSLVEIMGLTITFIIILAIVFLLSWLTYEKIIKKQSEYEIQNEELKEIIPKEYGLVEGNFTEVYLRDEDSEKVYITKLRKKLNAKYYAKLLTYDEIEVVLKDKDGDLLKAPEKIYNFMYFKEHYKN